MTVSSLARQPMNSNRYPHNFVKPVAAEVEAEAQWLLGKQKHDAKMPLTACYTEGQRQGWMDAYNRRGRDAFLRCCEAEGMPADVALSEF